MVNIDVSRHRIYHFHHFLSVRFSSIEPIHTCAAITTASPELSHLLKHKLCPHETRTPHPHPASGARLPLPASMNLPDPFHSAQCPLAGARGGGGHPCARLGHSILPL